MQLSSLTWLHVIAAAPGLAQIAAACMGLGVGSIAGRLLYLGPTCQLQYMYSFACL